MVVCFRFALECHRASVGLGHRAVLTALVHGCPRYSTGGEALVAHMRGSRNRRGGPVRRIQKVRRSDHRASRARLLTAAREEEERREAASGVDLGPRPGAALEAAAAQRQRERAARAQQEAEEAARRAAAAVRAAKAGGLGGAAAEAAAAAEVMRARSAVLRAAELEEVARADVRGLLLLEEEEAE